ncbi:unnamed protein product, partial [Laminaria digitata]
KAVLALARTSANARLSSPSSSSSSSSTKAAEKEERRRCPDALLVRSLEALGRVYMHREAALVRDASGEMAGVFAALGQQAALLLPMPFSLKMRELMVWATNTVLPVMARGRRGADGAEKAGGEGTPGELGLARRLVAESPSPLPPPRSRARSDAAGLSAPAAVCGGGDGGCGGDGAGGGGGSVLAEGVFGVVVLLASEWVGVGSGLAEISMRAETWGNRLLALLLQEEECRESVVAVIPQLCRLSLHLSARETQGARPPGSIWEVLLRCADVRVSTEKGMGDGESGGSTCVQKCLAEAVALQGRKGGLPLLSERLLSFMFTQASAAERDEDGEYEEEVERTAGEAGLGIDALTRLEVLAEYAAAAAAAAGTPAGDKLSRPAAAVLAGVLRSSQASKAVGTLVLSHLAGFRGGDGAGKRLVFFFFTRLIIVLLQKLFRTNFK